MLEQLVRRLNTACDEQPFQIGWYLKVLRSGQTAARNGDVVVPGASTRKIEIMMTTFKAVNEGRLALDQPLTIEAKYQDNDSGAFQHLRPGFTITLRDALVMMIVISDNTCTGAVVDLVGLERINAWCRTIGMRNTTHRYGIPPRGLGRDHALELVNTTTPADMGLVLDLILQGASDVSAAARLGCTPESCQLAIEILSWQKERERLPLFLPAGTKVANKTGNGVRNSSDVGIVYSGELPLFILSVYTEHLPENLPDMSGFAAANLLIGRLARTCYDALVEQAA